MPEQPTDSDSSNESNRALKIIIINYGGKIMKAFVSFQIVSFRSSDDVSYFTTVGAQTCQPEFLS